MIRQRLSGSITIALGQSLSSPMSAAGFVGGHLYLPVLDNAALTFQVSYDGTAFQNLYDAANTEIAVPASTGDRAVTLPASLAGAVAFKVRSGTAALPVNQTALRTITVALVA